MKDLIKKHAQNFRIASKILQKTTPFNATNQIENKIWTTNISKNSLAEFKQNYNLLSSSFNEDFFLFSKSNR